MKSPRRACRISPPPATARRRRPTTPSRASCRAIPRRGPDTNLNFANVPPDAVCGRLPRLRREAATSISRRRSSSPTAARSCSSGTSRSIRCRRRRSVRRSLRAWARCRRAATTSFTFNGTAGQLVEIFVDADNTTTGTPNPDLTFALLDPNGDEIQFVDSAHESRVADPGAAARRARTRSSWTASSRRSSAISCIACRKSKSSSRCCRTTTCCSSCRTARSSARSPSRTCSPTGRSRSASFRATTLQMVIARANTPERKNRNVADRIRYVGFGGVNPQEYFSYLDPVTYGHNSAAGANGIAAYAFFAPFVPEAFTSPGPSTIYFDKNNKRFKHPEIRQKPDMAAMDGANTTFFMQRFVGRSGYVPELLRHQRSGAACSGDRGAGARCGGRPGHGQAEEDAQDPAGQRVPARPRSVLLVGLRAHARERCWRSTRSRTPQRDQPVRPERVHADALRLPQPASRSTSTAATPIRRRRRTGIVFDERPTPQPLPGQPFVIGIARSGSMPPTSRQRSRCRPIRRQWRASGSSWTSPSQRDRSAAATCWPSAWIATKPIGAGPLNGAAGGNSADLLGGGVLIPSGTIASGRRRASSAPSRAARRSGAEFFNLIGKGYSQLDGFGFVNAEAAVKAVSKKKK